MRGSETMRARPAGRRTQGSGGRGAPGRLRRAAAAAGAFWLTVGAAGGAAAQLFGGKQEGRFKRAPGTEAEAEAGAAQQGPDTILGIIDINTAFFIAVGVIAFFWFVFGGGRKAKVGNPSK